MSLKSHFSHTAYQAGIYELFDLNQTLIVPANPFYPLLPNAIYSSGDEHIQSFIRDINAIFFEVWPGSNSQLSFPSHRREVSQLQRK